MLVLGPPTKCVLVETYPLFRVSIIRSSTQYHRFHCICMHADWKADSLATCSC